MSFGVLSSLARAPAIRGRRKPRLKWRKRARRGERWGKQAREEGWCRPTYEELPFWPGGVRGGMGMGRRGGAGVFRLLVQSLHPFVGAALSLLARVAVAFLQFPYQQIALSADDVQVVVGELAELLLHASSELFPLP